MGTLYNVTSIGTATFDSCKAAVFNIKGKVKEIGGESFCGCESLERMDLSEVKIIPERAFMRCETLKEITLSPKLQLVNEGAFRGCKSLEKMVFAKQVSFISETALMGCTSLKEIIVDENNNYYCSIDGVLFKRNATKLIKFPSAKTITEYEIPDSVIEIGDWAFEGCKSIVNIKCHSIVKYFGSRVFDGCSNLKHCSIRLDNTANSESVWNLGVSLFMLKDASEETKKNGFDLILKAVKSNHPEAQAFLNLCYRKGKGFEIDLNKIPIKYYRYTKEITDEIASYALEQIAKAIQQDSSIKFFIKDSQLEYGTYTDLRDGYTYKTIKIGNKTWLAENLRYLPELGNGCFVYGYNGYKVSEAKSTQNYQDYGVLYNMQAAKKACLPGWHLPSDEEWEDLGEFLGASSRDEKRRTGGVYVNYKGIYGGRLLNNKALWDEDILTNSISNPIGFDAVPGGWRTYQCNYDGLHETAKWWSSTVDDPQGYGFYHYWLLYYLDSGVGYGASSEVCCLSVRCVKDD